jgi:fascin 1
LGKYLSVDTFGNVLCESEERDTGSRFQISIADDNSGRWALKNEQRGYFLGGTPEKLTCTAKAPGKGEYWSVHLAARPQVSKIELIVVGTISIQNAMQMRFVRCVNNNNDN